MSLVRMRSQEALDKSAEEAEMLEAAEAQARAEEEIGHRLPREVLNLIKRFELQQHSLDTMQGNLLQLTDMVAQIALALKPPPPPQSEGEHQDENIVAFTTPHPQKYLSPIYKGETPPSAPSPSDSQSTMQRPQIRCRWLQTPTQAKFPIPD
jgi:hypothetical protein